MNRQNDWIKAYEEMLEDEEIDYERIKKYVFQFMPSKLYRYRAFDKYYESNIINGEVHLSFANSFNDPFDCAVKFDYKLVVEKFFGDFGLVAYRNSSKMQESFNQHQKDTFKKFQKNIKIACFSELNDSMLMWSHYANNHTGYCIEYDTRKSELFKQLILPVIYKNERYNATKCLITNNPNIAYNPVLYKSKDWAYEREWRMYGTKKFFEVKSDNLKLREAITAVYLGACINEEDLKRIEEWGKINHIAVYKMSLDSQTYKLVYS